jgi:hypothetical protein
VTDQQAWTLLILAVIGFVIWKAIPPRVKGALILCTLLMLAAGLYSYALANGYGTGTGVLGHPKVTQLAKADIPTEYRKLYQQAGRRYGVPWTILAGIGKIESDHGRSSAPGVRSGVNRFGCCAGPMQFNLTNGPPSTWDAYGRGGSPYKPEHAIPAAARLLVANGAKHNMDRALYGYNHSWAYVRDVKAWSERYRTGRFS